LLLTVLLSSTNQAPAFAICAEALCVRVDSVHVSNAEDVFDAHQYFCAGFIVEHVSDIRLVLMGHQFCLHYLNARLLVSMCMMCNEIDLLRCSRGLNAVCKHAISRLKDVYVQSFFCCVAAAG